MRHHKILAALRNAVTKAYNRFDLLLIQLILYMAPILAGIYSYESYTFERRALFAAHIAIILLYYISLPYLIRHKDISIRSRLHSVWYVMRRVAINYGVLAIILGIIASNTPSTSSIGLHNITNIYDIFRLLWQGYVNQLLFMTLVVASLSGVSLLSASARSFVFGAKNPVATTVFMLISVLSTAAVGLSDTYPISSPHSMIFRIVALILLFILIAAIVEYINATSQQLLNPHKQLSERIKDAINHRKEAGDPLPPPAAIRPRLGVAIIELGILYLIMLYMYLFGLQFMGAQLATFTLIHMLKIASDTVWTLLMAMAGVSLLTWFVSTTPLMLAFGLVRIDNTSGYMPSWRKNLLVGFLKAVAFGICLLILVALSFAAPIVMNALGTKWVPILVAYDYLGMMLIAASGAYITLSLKKDRGLIDILSGTRVVQLFKPYAWRYRAIYIVILVGLAIGIVPYMKWVNTIPVPVAQLMQPSLFAQYKTFWSSKGWSVSYNPFTTTIYSDGERETINMEVGNCTTLIYVRVFWPSDGLRIDRTSAKKFTLSGYDAWDLFEQPNEKAPHLTYTNITVDVGEKIFVFSAMSSAYDTENKKFMPKSECIQADREVRRLIGTFRYEKP